MKLLVLSDGTHAHTKLVIYGDVVATRTINVTL